MDSLGTTEAIIHVYVSMFQNFCPLRRFISVLALIVCFTVYINFWMKLVYPGVISSLCTHSIKESSWVEEHCVNTGGHFQSSHRNLVNPSCRQKKLNLYLNCFYIIMPKIFTVPARASKEGTDEERHNFVTGDVVEVAEGDLANLKGTVLSIDGNKITIMPKHEDLKVCIWIARKTKWIELSGSKTIERSKLLIPSSEIFFQVNEKLIYITWVEVVWVTLHVQKDCW